MCSAGVCVSTAVLSIQTEFCTPCGPLPAMRLMWGEGMDLKRVHASQSQQPMFLTE